MNSLSKLGVLTSALLVACGGGGGGGAAKCNADAECSGVGARCLDHVCQIALTVVITSPAATITYAKGVVHVEIEVANGTADSVELLVNDVPVVTLSAPFRTDWDAAGKADGSYQLVARATVGGRPCPSEPRTVIVDHEPPKSFTVNPREFTNQRPAPVDGTTDAGATVTIYEAGQVIGTDVADERGAWSTKLDLAPGPEHALTARATDPAGNSTPDTTFSITVDQAPLVITAQTPRPGATNVWSREPITVTFNKPLDPAKISTGPASIRLARQDATPGTSTTVPLATPQLSDKNRTLALRPTVVPQGPCSLTLTLPAGLADVFGNALAETQWTWAVPEWQDLGAALKVDGSYNAPVPRIAISSDDRPAVGVYVCEDGCVTWLVEWTGPSGGWVERLEAAIGWNSSVDFDALGRPVMVWEGLNCPYTQRCNRPGAVNDISHGRWDGESFVVTKTISGPNYAIAPAIRVDASGNQVMAWVETESGQQHVVGKVWNGGWVSLESPSGAPSEDVTALDPALDAHGNAGFIWHGDRWLDGAAWFAATSTWSMNWGLAFRSTLPAGTLAVEVDAAAQNAYALIRETVTDTTATPPQSVAVLKVHRLSCAEWTCTDTVLGESSSGGVLNLDPKESAREPSLALDPDGSPVVAWVEGLNVYVKRWDPGAGGWKPLGAAGDGSGSAVWYPSLVIGGDGVVAVAFTLGNNIMDHATLVKRYNGSWTLTTPPPKR